MTTARACVVCVCVVGVQHAFRVGVVFGLRVHSKKNTHGLSPSTGVCVCARTAREPGARPQHTRQQSRVGAGAPLAVCADAHTLQKREPPATHKPDASRRRASHQAQPARRWPCGTACARSATKMSSFTVSFRIQKFHATGSVAAKLIYAWKPATHTRPVFLWGRNSPQSIPTMRARLSTQAANC